MGAIPAQPRLRYETIGDILARDIPEREFLVSPWLRQGESALIYAAPGIGKSMLTLTLSLAVAGGGSFLNWSAPKPRRVLYLDGEMAVADVQERARCLLPTVSGIDAEAAGRNLVMLARQAQHPDVEFPDLGTPEGQRTLLRKVRAGRVDLLVIDNLSTTFSCEDENSAAAIRPAVKLLMRLKQAGVACILVHHTNKTGESYRGSSMLATTFEVIFGLTRGADMKDDHGPAFELTFSKFRGKRRDDVVVPRAVHLAEDGTGLEWRQEKAARQEVQDLIAAVQSGKFSSQAELAGHFGVSVSTINRRKTDAVHKFRLLTEDAWDAYLRSGKDASDGEEF